MALVFENDYLATAPKKKTDSELLREQMIGSSGGSLESSSTTKLAPVLQGASQLSNTAQGGGPSDALGGALQGGALGASTGTPHGAIIGAGAGALAGIMGGRARRKEQARKAKQEALQNIAQIEQQKGMSQAQILGNLMSSIGSRR